MVGLSRNTVYRLIREGQFPSPIRLGRQAVGWTLASIEDWIVSRPLALGAGLTAATKR